MSTSDKETGHQAAHIQKRDTSDREARKAKQHDEGVGAIKSIADELETSRESCKASDRKSHALEKLAIGLIFLTFVATGVGDWIFYRTMKTSHADNVAALNAEDRPWVGVSGVSITTIEASNPVTVTVTITNTGHSPALSLEIWFLATIASGPRGECPVGEQHLPNSPSPKGILLPNQNAVVTITIAKAVTQLGVDDLKSGICVLKIAGRMDYSDARNKPHYTTTRMAYDVDVSGFVSEPAGNDAK